LFSIFHRLSYCARSAFVFLSLSLSLSLFAFVARTGPCKFVRRRPGGGGGGSISCGLISDRVDRSISYPLRVCSMFIKYWSAPRNDNRFPHFPVRRPYALIFSFLTVIIVQNGPISNAPPPGPRIDPASPTETRLSSRWW